MGTMYTRKPFSSLRHSKHSQVDPDEVLREVKAPSIPPPLRSAVEGETSAAESSSRLWTFTALRDLRTNVGEQLTGRPFATLGAMFAVGALVGTLLGSRFARVASVVAIGSLLHARRDALRKRDDAAPAQPAPSLSN